MEFQLSPESCLLKHFIDAGARKQLLAGELRQPNDP